MVEEMVRQVGTVFVLWHLRILGRDWHVISLAAKDLLRDCRFYYSSMGMTHSEPIKDWRYNGVDPSCLRCNC